MTKHFSEPPRILLINAIDSNVEVERRYPGLGLAYLVSSVRKELPEANIEFRISDSAVIEEIDSYSPNLVGISSVSQNFNIAKKYADFCAEREIPVIMGGIHVSELPECLPGSATVGCRHEGEHTFVELIKVFLDEKFSPESLTDIPGISFWKNGLLQHNEDCPTIDDMDQLPMPARDLLNIRSHTYMFTSRGCPYRCAFCASSRFWSQLRFFSAEYVVDEIECLVRDYQVNMISFFDDLFIANRPRLEEIVRLLDKRQLLGKVRYTCSCRANTVDKPTARLLSKMGVVSVGMGLESGDDETLQFLKGRSARSDQKHSGDQYLEKSKNRSERILCHRVTS